MLIFLKVFIKQCTSTKDLKHTIFTDLLYLYGILANNEKSAAPGTKRKKLFALFHHGFEMHTAEFIAYSSTAASDTPSANLAKLLKPSRTEQTRWLSLLYK